MKLFQQLSLRGKMIAIAVAGTLITGTVTSLFAYVQVRDTEFAAAEERLEAAATLHADQLRATLALVATDAQALAAMPPVPGIIRTSRQPDGIDPVDSSTLTLWRLRLEQIFTSVLKTRGHYTQLRFIGAADNWRELVRVNRTETGIRPVPGPELQSKGAEPYLQYVTAPAGGEARFSRVTYNREHGRAVGPPTLRLVRPVTDGAGQLFGAVVINMDFAGLLRAARFTPSPETELHVLTDAGDHMTFGPDTASPLAFHEDADWQPSDFAPAVSGAGRDGLDRAGGRVYRASAIVSAQAGAPFGLTLVTATTEEALYAGARATLFRSAVLSALLVVFAGAVAAVLGARLPLGRLAAAMRDHRPDAAPIEVPAVVDAETRAIADSFATMSSALLRQTRRITAIHSGMPDPIVTIDAQGRIEDVNPAAEALFGYRAGDLKGGPLEVLMPDDMAPLHAGFLRAASAEPGTRPMTTGRDIFGRRRDGSLVPLEISISRVEYDGGAHFVGVLRDITERKRAESEMAALVAALERSNEELDRFAYVASHDLKAPLRVIDNAAGWLEEDLDGMLTEDTRESLGMLRGRVRRMERLLDDLLAHSRIGRTDEAEERVTGEALATSLRGLCDLPGGMRLHVSDRFRAIELPTMPITTILLNLLGNAIKHHDRTDGNIWLDAQSLGGALEITVTDDGPGIPPEYHERVFEMFQTLRPRDEVDGSGLGLAMVRKYAVFAGGEVTLRSDGSRGCRFTVRLPLPGAGRGMAA